MLTHIWRKQRLSHTGSFGWSVSSGEIFWSEETFRIFGFDRSIKPTLELVTQRVHPEDAERVQQFLERAARDTKDFGIDPWISIQGLDKDEWRRRVEAWRALGSTHLAVDTMRAGFKTPQAHMEAIRSFREVLR